MDKKTCIDELEHIPWNLSREDFKMCAQDALTKLETAYKGKFKLETRLGDCQELIEHTPALQLFESVKDKKTTIDGFILF
jgi:hypothetical protein